MNEPLVIAPLRSVTFVACEGRKGRGNVFSAAFMRFDPINYVVLISHN